MRGETDGFGGAVTLGAVVVGAQAALLPRSVAGAVVVWGALTLNGFPVSGCPGARSGPTAPVQAEGHCLVPEVWA